MKMYNITHAADLDGIASAALLVRYHKIPIKNVIFTNYKGKIFDEMIKFIATIKGPGNVVIISDFGMNDSNVERMKIALQGLKKKKNLVLWFDHHPWSNEQIKSLQKYCDFMIVGENAMFCGAELVYRFLCKKDKFGDELTRITHLSDFNLHTKKDDKLIDRLGFAIKYLGHDGIPQNNKLRKMVSLVSEGKLNDKYIMNAYNAYQKESRAHIKSMLKSVKILNVHEIKIVVGFAQKIQGHQACMLLLKKFKADMAIYVSTNSGNSSIRSVKRVDCSKLARALEGGGHPQASGFTFEGTRFDKKGLDYCLKRIENKANKLY